MPLARDTLYRFFTDIYIETGSANGRSLNFALDAGFGKCYGCEISSSKVKHCRQIFSGLDVQVFQGDSGLILGHMLAELPCGEFTMLLDAHQFDSLDAIGEKQCPLLDELEHLRKFRADDLFVD